MAKAKRKTAAKAEAVETPVVASEVVTEQVEAPAPAVKTGPKRAPLPQARAHNMGNKLVSEDGAVQSADVCLTSKGTNPRKLRVYGYDNLAEGNGRVPKDKRVALVPGIASTPKGVADAQWTKLVGLVQGNGNLTVSGLYDNGVASRTVRRAYRAGALRFVA